MKDTGVIPETYTNFPKTLKLKKIKYGISTLTHQETQKFAGPQKLYIIFCKISEWLLLLHYTKKILLAACRKSEWHKCLTRVSTENKL